MNSRKFHSCFATDVSIDAGGAVITDSTRARWHVDLAREGVKDAFKAWLKDVFLKGVAQTLTVFEYENRGEGVDIGNWIVAFPAVKPAEQLVNG